MGFGEESQLPQCFVIFGTQKLRACNGFDTRLTVLPKHNGRSRYRPNLNLNADNRSELALAA